MDYNRITPGHVCTQKGTALDGTPKTFYFLKLANGQAVNLESLVLVRHTVIFNGKEFTDHGPLDVQSSLQLQRKVEHGCTDMTCPICDGG